MLLNTSSASNPKLIRKRNKAEDELQLYYEVTNSIFTLERKRDTSCTQNHHTHHLVWLYSLWNEKPFDQYLPATQSMQRQNVLHIICPHTNSQFTIALSHVGSHRRWWFQYLDPSWREVTQDMAPTHSRVLLTCQGMGRSTPSPEPSASVSQRSVSKLIFCSTLHQRLQSCLQKVLYLWSNVERCIKNDVRPNSDLTRALSPVFLTAWLKYLQPRLRIGTYPWYRSPLPGLCPHHAPLVKSLPPTCLCFTQPQNSGSVICSELSFQDLHPFEAELSVTAIPSRRRLCEQAQIYRDRDGLAVMRL